LICLWDQFDDCRASTAILARKAALASLARDWSRVSRCVDVRLDAELSFGVWWAELQPADDLGIHAVRHVMECADQSGQLRTAAFARNNLACSLADRATMKGDRRGSLKSLQMFARVLSERQILRHELGLAWTTYRIERWNLDWEVKDESITSATSLLLTSLLSRGVYLPQERYEEIDGVAHPGMWVEWDEIVAQVGQIARLCTALSPPSSDDAG